MKCDVVESTTMSQLPNEENKGCKTSFQSEQFLMDSSTKPYAQGKHTWQTRKNLRCLWYLYISFIVTLFTYPLYKELWNVF